jgi:hypothetical protein
MDWTTGVHFLAGARMRFYLCHCAQTGPGAHPFPYSVAQPRGKGAGA